MINILTNNTNINNIYPGSISRTILESVAGEIEILYDNIDESIRIGYLSTATGSHLDLIGDMFGLKRRIELSYNSISGTYQEMLITDEKYRYEISEQIKVHAKGNENSIKGTVESIAGVKACILSPFYNGPGTFLITIIPEFGFDIEEIKRKIKASLEEMVSFGTTFEIKTPKMISIETVIELLFDSSFAEEKRKEARIQVKNIVMNYINSLGPGNSFLYNDLYELISISNKSILDFRFQYINIEDEPIFESNYFVEADEFLVPKYVNII